MIDICVCCGEYVPEGKMVCPICVRKYTKKEENADAGNRSSHLVKLRDQL